MANNNFHIVITYSIRSDQKKIWLTPEEYFDEYDPSEVYSVDSAPRYIQLSEFIDEDSKNIESIDLYVFNRLNKSALSLKKLNFSNKNWFSVRRDIENGVVVFSEYMTEIFDVDGNSSQIIKVDEKEEDSLKLISHSLIREKEGYPDEIMDLKIK